MGQWVVGFKYDDTKLAEGRPLNRLDLDEAVPDHPAVVGHRGGHTSVYNSRAFALAGVDADTPDPDGGKFYRAEGALTGLVAERANYVFRSLIPNTHTDDDRQAGVALITKLMAQAGLTSFHDAGTSAASLRAYRAAYEAGELRCRVYMLMRGPYEDLRRAGVATGFGDEWLRVGPVKYGADGSASERTMRMSTPYVGRPDDYGILTMTPGRRHPRRRSRSGAPLRLAGRHPRKRRRHHRHGAGRLRARAGAAGPARTRRHRIEHCSLVNPELLAPHQGRRRRPHPLLHLRPLPREQVGRVRPREDGVDVRPPVVPGPRNPRGAGVGLHSGSLRAAHAVQSMATRTDFDGRVWGASQRISVAEALRICTMGGAFASFEEHEKGSIAAGKLADFVALAADPHDVAPGAVKEIPVLRTVAGGATTHEA